MEAELMDCCVMQLVKKLAGEQQHPAWKLLREQAGNMKYHHQPKVKKNFQQLAAPPSQPG